MLSSPGLAMYDSGIVLMVMFLQITKVGKCNVAYMRYRIVATSGSSAGVGCMLMWLFMALCLICGYPVTYLSSQESLRRLGVHIPTWIYVCLLVLGGILIRNLSFFLALEGSLLGVTVGFTLPGMMFVILSYKTTWAKGKRSILLFSWSSIVIGIFCTVVGVVSTCITG